MPEAFKHRFNADIIAQMGQHFALASQRIAPADPLKHFDESGFVKAAVCGLESLELKARSNHIKDALTAFLPTDFSEAATLIMQALGPASDRDNIEFDAHPQGLSGWMMMPVTDYIAQAALTHGEQYLSEAFSLIHACTQRFSAEFSIRPLLRDHTHKTLVVLNKWALDNNVHVRRLVSEGCRPYLPWGLRLHVFAQNPLLIIPLLDVLKDDPSEYVRRSVANNINDIAKEHPDMVADLATKWWDEKSITRTRLIKHACRTLLKNGHPQVLSLFGFAPTENVHAQLTLAHKEVTIGDAQTLSLSISNNSNMAQSLLVDYAVNYQKANGLMSPKVFKCVSVTVPAKSQKQIVKRHSFKPVTTRKYYVGLHEIHILINGEVAATKAFMLDDGATMTAPDSTNTT